jgi:RimJ/RimL family protein N-acetyltransferase
MELRVYSNDDLELTVALECDPDVMRELGGPVSREGAEDAHRRRVEGVKSDPWWFAIVPEKGGPAAGAIGIWSSQWQDEPVDEVGWMVLPDFQGRGIASEALGLLIERARAQGRSELIHAFPGVTNGASNALCRKYGFTHLGESEVKFRDRPLRVNHWALHLSTSD